MLTYILQNSHLTLRLDFNHLAQITLAISSVLLSSRTQLTLATAVVTVAIDLT